MLLSLLLTGKDPVLLKKLMINDNHSSYARLAQPHRILISIGEYSRIFFMHYNKFLLC